MDAPLAESPACPEWRETEYQSFLRAISWSPSLSLIKPMRSDSACKRLSLGSFALFVAAFARENSAELPRIHLATQQNNGFPMHVASTEKIYCLDHIKFKDGILLSLPKFSFVHMTL